MKKIKNVLLIALIITNIYTHEPTWIEETILEDVTPFTTTVLHHYYTIERLNNVINALKKIPRTIVASLPFNHLPLFTHADILTGIADIKKTKTLQLLLKQWDSITTYKSINDHVYMKEYCLLIYTLLMMIKNHHTKYPTQFSHIHIDDIIFRFFLIHRLKNIDTFLQECIRQEPNSKDLTALLHLFAQFKNYQFINDPVFTKEFLTSLFFTIKNIKNDSVEEIIDTIKSLIETELTVSSDHFNNYVFRRYYFIKRLKKSIELFDKINKYIEQSTNAIDAQKLFEFDIAMHFKHHKIKESVEEIKKKHNFKPLFSVWNDFSSYKSLDDQLFIEEFTKEIFVISKHVLSQTNPHQIIYKSLLPLTLYNVTAEELLDEIDICTDLILHSHKLPLHSLKLYKKNDIKPFAHINSIILHFYYIKRLNPSLSLLQSLQSRNYFYKLLSHDSATFHHYKIINCITLLRTTKSLKPLIELLYAVKQYRYFQDIDFIRELLLLLCTVYKNIFENRVKEKSYAQKSAFTTLLEISATIDKLPIAELLNTIDMLVEELPAFLEKYEFHSDMTWKKWLRKYWWVPPVIIGWFGLKILLQFQHKKYGYAYNFYQPKPEPATIITDPVLLELRT